MQLSLEAIKHVGAPSSYYREPRGVSAGDIYFDDYSFRPVKESSYKIVIDPIKGLKPPIE